MRDHVEILKSLRAFATPAELRTLNALIEHGGASRAAVALGQSRGTVRGALLRVKQRAHEGVLPTLPGAHRMKGVSTLTDGAGDVVAQWAKTERDSDDPPRFEPVPAGHHVSKVSTLLDAQGQVRAQWVQAPQDKIAQEAALIEALRQSVEGYRGILPPVPAPTATRTEIETHYNLGDPHIGMLSWAAETGDDFDLKIAEQDLCATMDRLVQGAEPSRLGRLINLGDFFHAEDDNQRTPGHGNKVDVDSRASKVARVGINIVRWLVDRMLEKHELVEVRNIPGNHDPVAARWLSLVLEMLYEREPRIVVVPNMNPYQFAEFGLCMFLWSHGDGAKPEALPGLAAAREPAMWGRTRFRYSHGGHIHHETKKEFPGMVHETHRTLAGRDAWHNAKGYDAGRALSAITYHERFGEVGRKTVDISQVRQ